MIGSAHMVEHDFIKPLVFQTKIIAKDTPLLLKNRKGIFSKKNHVRPFFDSVPQWSSMTYSPSLDTYAKMDFVGAVRIFCAPLSAYLFQLSSLITSISSLLYIDLKENFGDRNPPKQEHLL